jgi:Uma2 family endonuclease
MVEAISKPSNRRAVLLPRSVSLEAYFRAEDKSVQKNEFHAGIIRPMAGAKLNHNILASKAVKLLDNFVEDNDFRYKVSNSDTKIRIEASNKVVYPDAVVICEKPKFFNGRQDTITNPLLIVEVTSDSTKKHDRGSKFDDYRTIPSFKEYVLINQESKHVTVYTKQADETWILRDYHGEDATAILYILHNCPLPLKRLYWGLDL